MKNQTTPAAMPTADQIREEMERAREQVKQYEAAADAALKLWREQINSAGGLKKYIDSTPYEERTIRQAEKSANNARDILKVLKNNYLVAKWREVAPAVVDVLNQYAGKPYGEKTKEKIKNELYKRAGFYIYIERGRAWRLWIAEATPQGFTAPAGAKFEIYADGGAAFLDDNNRITPPPFASWIVSGLKPYAEDPAALVAKLAEQRKQARALWEQLRDICREYNNAAPEGFEDLDPYRPANI